MQTQRSPLARAEDREVVVGGADALEPKALGVGVAAGRCEKADAQVKVLADPKAPGAIGGHAGADVAGDLVPDGHVRLQARVRLPLWRHNPRDPSLDQGVCGSSGARVQADSRRITRNIDVRGVEARHQVYECIETFCFGYSHDRTHVPQGCQE